MTGKYQSIIFYLLSILLISELFLEDNNYFEFLKFLTTVVFIWKSLSSDDTKQTKFAYLSIAVLFNPFYNFNIDKEFYSFLFFITGITILIINFFVFHRNNLTNHLKIHKEKYLKILSFIFFLMVSIFLYKKNANEKRHQELLIELNNEKLEKIRNDSIQEVKQKLELAKKEELSKKYCIESEALKYFKEHMDLYNPQFSIKSIPKIKYDGNCVFTISCTVKNTKYQYINSETLICTINLNSNGEFNQYLIRYIDKPSGLN